MNRTELKSEKSLKKWKKQKEQIIAVKDWTKTSLIDYITLLRSIYLKMIADYTDKQLLKSKKKRNEFKNQINEVLCCIWYCKELHLFYLLFPPDVKEQLLYTSSYSLKYKQYLADHHNLYLQQTILEPKEVDNPITNFEVIMNEELLTKPPINHTKARFYTINLLISFLDDKVDNFNHFSTPQSHSIHKLKWMRSKIDLSVLIVYLTKTDCFTCHLGNAISSSQLAEYFENIIDIDLKKGIHQTFNNVLRQKEDKSIIRDMSSWFEKERVKSH